MNYSLYLGFIISSVGVGFCIFCVGLFQGGGVPVRLFGIYILGGPFSPLAFLPHLSPLNGNLMRIKLMVGFNGTVS